MWTIDSVSKAAWNETFKCQEFMKNSSGNDKQSKMKRFDNRIESIPWNIISLQHAEFVMLFNLIAWYNVSIPYMNQLEIQRAIFVMWQFS